MFPLHTCIVFKTIHDVDLIDTLNTHLYIIRFIGPQNDQGSSAAIPTATSAIIGTGMSTPERETTPSPVLYSSPPLPKPITSIGEDGQPVLDVSTLCVL